MANETTASTATELIVTEAVNTVVLEALYASMVIAPLIRNEECPGNTTAMEFPIYNDVSGSVTAPGEATDLSNTALNPTSATVTAAEVGIMTTVTDLLVTSSPASLEGIGRELGRALGVYIDTAIAALFASLNGGTSVGTTTANMTVSDLLDAHYQLDLDDVPDDRKCVLHPVQKMDLINDMNSSGSGPIFGYTTGDRVAATRKVMILDTEVVTSTVCPTANTSADRVGALFHENAMAILWKWRTRTETERDASLRATEVVVTACYGVGEISDDRGVPIVTDA